MNEKTYVYLVAAFLLSLLIDNGLIFLSKRKPVFMDRTDTGEPQKFHHIPTPRAGGLGIFLSFFAVLTLYNFRLSLLFALSSLPVFFIGALEDFKRNISPRNRILWMIMGTIVCMLLFKGNAVVKYVGFATLPLIIAVPFTIFAVVGFTNAVNIVDGFNGLASGISIPILLFLAKSFYDYGDQDYAFCCLLLVASIFGFFLLNFPKGKIFLGDGGTYFIGFSIAVLSIILLNRHPVFPPWYPFALGIYPVWETLFSIVRKKFVRKMSPFMPDKAHFHMLVYHKLTRQNSLTSVVIWIFNLPFMVLAYLFRYSTTDLILLVIIFCSCYTLLYRSIISFKLGKLLGK